MQGSAPASPLHLLCFDMAQAGGWTSGLSESSSCILWSFPSCSDQSHPGQFRLHPTRPLPNSWPRPVPLTLHPHWFLGWPCCFLLWSLGMCRDFLEALCTAALHPSLPQHLVLIVLLCPARTTVCSYVFFLFIFSNMSQVREERVLF